MDYESFLDSKRLRVPDVGFEIDESEINPMLKPFQKAVSVWTVRKGICGVFSDTGTGKGPIAMEFCRLNTLHGGTSLITAPLVVAKQFLREARKFGYELHYARHGSELVRDAINVTNYDNIHNFNPQDIDVLAADESSILKGLNGKTRKYITEAYADTRRKISLTATPDPNSDEEMCRQIEFLGWMTERFVLATFFDHKKDGYHLSGNAEQPWYEFLASMAMTFRKPSDLGDFSDEGYITPGFEIYNQWVKTDYVPEGKVIRTRRSKEVYTQSQMIATGLDGITDRARVRRGTLEDRACYTAELVNDSRDVQWIVWRGLLAEADTLSDMIPDALDIRGSQTPEQKSDMIESFQDGNARVIIIDPKIGQFGLNLQNCWNQVWCGLTDSYESFYQGVKRSDRYGQSHKVNVHVVLSELEDAIWQNVKEKWDRAEIARDGLLAHTQVYEQAELAKITLHEENYMEDEVTGEHFRILLGDSVTRLTAFPASSVDLIITSIPFGKDLYAYHATPRDVGNCATDDQFWQHLGLITDHMYRMLRPGRACMVHTFDIPAMLVKDGYIGMKDFSGDTIRHFESHGFVYDGYFLIPKNQQAVANRTHNVHLTKRSVIETDQVNGSGVIGDRVLKFRKPGKNAVPVRDTINMDTWIEYADQLWPGVWDDGEIDRAGEMGVFAWDDILATDVYDARNARDPKDRRHPCQLQIKLVDRLIDLYSNPGEIIFDPYLGTGTVAARAVAKRRFGCGCELKPSYFQQAVKICQAEESTRTAGTLFEYAEQQASMDEDLPSTADADTPTDIPDADDSESTEDGQLEFAF